MRKLSRTLAVLLLLTALVVLLPAAPAHAAGAGWVKEDGVWYYTNAAGEKITNDWVKSSGKWYYFGEDGTMAADTWVDDYYVNASGAMQASKWVAVGDDWSYVSASGVRVKSGWQKIGGNWYWFADGLMVTGPVAVDGKNYFFKDNGAMLTGWRQDEDGWHYYSASGVRREAGWQKIGSNWYWFADGLMVTGPVVIDGQSYFFKDSGTMLTGWVQDGDSWRYFASNGTGYAEKWLKSGGKWYYFDADGLMLADAWLTAGGKTYHFAPSGVMQTGWQELDDSWYYFKGGVMQIGWLQLGGSWYYFAEDGAMVTGEVEINGKVNLFKDSGAWVKELGVPTGYEIIEAGSVATLCLPQGLKYSLSVNPYAVNPSGLPCGMAVLEASNGLHMYASRMGVEAYETAGLPMPASLEEYSQRAGVRSVLQEGEDFQTDVQGNLCLVRRYTQDGADMLFYYVLKQTDNAYGAIIVEAPDALALDAAYMLANSRLLPASTAAYQTVTAARVGSFHLPAQWSGTAPTDLLIDPLPQASTQLSFGDWQIFAARSGPETYWAAGVEMPADVEEYSRRSGPQAVLPEGLSYSYDAYGNLGFRREVQEDGKDYVVYYTLKQGDGCFGAIWMRGPADSDLNAPYILANSSLDGPGFRMVKAEGVATLCLPEEWAYTLSAAVGDRNPQGVLCEHAELDGPDGIRLETVRFAREDYEEAGLVIPASLEEHSQRPGNQSMLREGEEFSYDEWGNLGFARDTEDGGKLYYVLKQGSDAFGLVVLTLPAGVELPEAGYLLANFYLD